MSEIAREGGRLESRGGQARPELLRENNSGIMKLTHTQTQINTSRT